MANADIELLFGVLGGGSISGESGSRIKSELESIIKAINQSPLEVEVKLSDKSIKDFTAELEEVAKKAKKTAAKIRLAQSGDGSGPDIKKPYLDAYRQMLALMRKNQDANSRTTRSFVGLQEQAHVFRDALRLANVEQISIEEAFRKIGVSAQAALTNASESMAKFNAEMEHTGRSGSVSAKKLFDTVSSMQEVLNKNTFASELGSYQKVRDQFDAWAEAAENVRNGTMTVEEALESVGAAGLSASKKVSGIADDIASLKEQVKVFGLKEIDQVSIADEAAASKAAITAEKQAYDEATDAVHEYYKYLKDLKTSANDIRYDGAQYVSNSGHYKELAENLNRTADAYRKVKALAGSLSEENQASLLQVINEQERELNYVLEQRANREREAAKAADDRRSESAANKAAVKAETQAYAESAEAVGEYYKFLKEFKTGKHDIRQLDDGTFVSESGDYKELASDLNRTQEAYRKVKELSASLDYDNQAKLLQLVNKEQREYNRALEDFANAKRKAAAVSAANKENEEYKNTTDAIKQYYKVLTDVKTGTNDIVRKNGQYVSESGYYKHLADELNQVARAFVEVVKARSGLSDEHQASVRETLRQEIHKHNLVLEEQANKERAASQAADERAKKQSAIQAESAAYNKATDTVEKYFSVLTKVNKGAIDGSNDIKRLGKVYVSQSGEWDGLAQSMNRVKGEYSEINNLIKTLSPEHQADVLALITREAEKYTLALEDQNNKQRDAANRQNEADAYNKATKAVKDYYKALTDLASTQTDIRQLDDGTFVSESGDYKELADTLNRTKKAYDELGQSAGSMSAKHQELIKTLKAEEVNKYNRVLEDQANKQRKAAEAAAVTKTETLSLAAQMKTMLDNSNASNLSSYENLRTQVQAIDNALELAEQEGISVEQAFVRLGTTGATTFENARLAMAALKKEMVETGTAGDAIELYRTQMQQLDSTITSARKNLEKWTAARDGKSKDSYKAIEDAVKRLEQYRESINGTGRGSVELKSEIADAISIIKTSSAAIEEADENTASWGERIKSLFEKFGSWYSISQTFMEVVQSIKKMVSNVVELDTAMTELKKVTDETDATYSRFLDKAAERANKLGATMTDVVESTASFSRLGYGLDEASALADAAIVYKNVGDGIENIDEASESIISTMQAFGIEAQDAMTIVDRFNIVGKLNCRTT